MFITQADKKMNSFTLQSIVDESPVVAIVRRPKVDPVRCIEHLFEAGIRMVEITMDTAGAVEILRSLRSVLPSDVLLGAGTVTDVPRANAALVAGASFLVTPNLNMDVIHIARAHAVPIIPGAMTPTEIWNASVAGADFVKIFPASAVGPGFFREIRGPFPHIPLMATGGVNLENAHDLIKCGADVLGVGGALIPKSDDEFQHCRETAQRLLDIAREARTSR
jgi:2-dehydro-3-deoxyphosphogluconate aldolase/(4S)-4-hydroxy-2-oxoglutarate aldolase